MAKENPTRHWDKLLRLIADRTKWTDNPAAGMSGISKGVLCGVCCVLCVVCPVSCVLCPVLCVVC